MLQTVNQTATAVVLKDKTVERANIIAQRIGNLEIAIVKAMMLEQLDAKLADNQLAHIIFQKKNGSLREMWCSTNPSLCSKHVKGVHREHYGTKVVFDVEKGEFRSFRFESIIKVF
jgi:hypothetical protein